ncbi:MAG: GNAT family N-acetyltransferase [Clostridia bacterium]|nr:GNAT family N-acetyltransferase [Clostridia bacterium]
MIQTVNDSLEKCGIARLILEQLPEWFGIPEARESYIRKSAGETMIASFENGAPNGFLCLNETGKDTVEIAVMGVLKEYHRKGIGTKLFDAAMRIAAEQGYSFMQVKTVQMGRYEEYDRTNLFYQSCGFKEFELFSSLWDEHNPCQIYVRSVRCAK